MGLIILVFLSALILEGLGSYISIVGLASKTSYIIVAVAVTLDFAKITIASVLYKRWGKLPFFLKAYLLPTLICLIIFTSFGAFGYLSQEFSKTVLQQEQNSSQIEDMEKEQAKLEARKIEIDKQISQLPAEFVSQRKRLSDMFAPELQKVQERITTLDKEIPLLKSQNIQEAGTNGTISSAAKNIGISPESIIRVVSFFLVLFIDPLAIILLTMGNFLVEERKRDIKKSKLISGDTQDQLSLDTSSQDPITLSSDDTSLSKGSGQKKRSKKEKVSPSADQPAPQNFENNTSTPDLVNKSEPLLVEGKSLEAPLLATSIEDLDEQRSVAIPAPIVDPITIAEPQEAVNPIKNNVFTNYIKKEDSILTLSVEANAQAFVQSRVGLEANQGSDSLTNSIASLDELEETLSAPIETSASVKVKPNSSSTKSAHTPLENKSSASLVVLPGQVVQRNKPVGKFDFASIKEKPVTDNSDLAQMEKYIKARQSNSSVEEDADSSPI